MRGGRTGEEFERVLEAAPGVIEYEIVRVSEEVRGADPMTRQRALGGVQELIGERRGEVLVHEYSQLAADAFGIPADAMLAGVAGARAKKGGNGKGQGGANTSPADKLLGYVWAEPYELFLDQFGAQRLETSPIAQPARRAPPTPPAGLRRAAENLGGLAKTLRPRTPPFLRPSERRAFVYL